MSEKLTKEKIQSTFDGYVDKGTALLKDDEKIDRFLLDLEGKMKRVPVVGTQLADVAVLAQLIKAYVKKEYTEIPVASVAIAAGALLYFINPLDLIPDAIPVIGLADDVAIVLLAMTLIHEDMQEFKRWQRKESEKRLQMVEDEAIDVEIFDL